MGRLFIILKSTGGNKLLFTYLLILGKAWKNY